jgi:hypothetical protein
VSTQGKNAGRFDDLKLVFMKITGDTAVSVQRSNCVGVVLRVTQKLTSFCAIAVDADVDVFHDITLIHNHPI